MFNFLKKSSDRELAEELVKQLTISNMLQILNSQYNHPDSIIPIDEIQELYQQVFDEIKQSYLKD